MAGESAFDVACHGWARAISPSKGRFEKSFHPLPGKIALHGYHGDVIEPILLPPGPMDVRRTAYMPQLYCE
jgi:hypothetical protein